MWSLIGRVGYGILCLPGVAGGWSASGQGGMVSHLESRYDYIDPESLEVDSLEGSLGLSL